MDSNKRRRISNFILGDFNSKVGCRQSADEDCIGAHGKGKLNEYGQTLIDWSLQHHLFLCNTAFQHSSRHHTTWEGRFKPPEASLTVPVYNTIDFVIAPTKYCSLLFDSRSYAGTETTSDHRLVVSRIHLSNMYKLWHKKSSQPPKCIAVHDLTYHHPKRTEYIHRVKDCIAASTPNKSAQERLNNIRQILTTAAKEMVGLVSHHSHHNQNQFDSEICAKSKEQRNLRLMIFNCIGDEARCSLKQKRNRLQHEIRKLTLKRANADLKEKK